MENADENEFLKKELWVIETIQKITHDWTLDQQNYFDYHRVLDVMEY